MLCDYVLKHEPFPHLVWEELLPQDQYNKLLASMPRNEYYIQSRTLQQGSNNEWREYAKQMTDPTFHREIMNAFGIEFNDEIGLRGVSELPHVAESYYIRRTPSNEKWQLFPHVDSKYAITSMIHYFRDENDDDDTGELVLLRPTSSELSIVKDERIQYYDPKDFEILERVPYRGNFAICLLSGDNVWHGITPRKTNDRFSVNISLEHQNKGGTCSTNYQ